MNDGKLRKFAKNAEHEQHFYLRMLRQHFRPGMRWLDAGCGHSLIPQWMQGADEIEQKFLAEAQSIVGADVDAQSLSSPSSIRRIACDLEALAFENETFDFITCNMVVEHLAAPMRVFREYFRALRTGGVVIILTPNLYHWANIVSLLTPFWFHSWILKKLFNCEPEDVFPTRYRCNTKKAMQKMLRTAGFSSVTVHMIPGRPRLVDFGPLFYPEYLFYRLSCRFPQLREVLCAVAQKSPAGPGFTVSPKRTLHDESLLPSAGPR